MDVLHLPHQTRPSEFHRLSHIRSSTPAPVEITGCKLEVSMIFDLRAEAEVWGHREKYFPFLSASK